jgi:dTDP-4-dehydrorhamnose reductase
MRLLITGASGMLGYDMMRLARSDHEVWGTYRSFPVSVTGVRTLSMDLTDETQVREQLKSMKPEAIIHTAALTDVDQCERDRFSANRINSAATKFLALLAGDLGARLVYISTDYVFDGKRGNYVESDPPRPINVYGETKLLGEEGATSGCPNALIIRTSIIGLSIQPKSGQVKYIMESLRRRESITRFSDQFWTPIYTGDLSRLILELLARKSEGLFHIGGGEKISRYSFAIKVAETLSLPRGLIQPTPFKDLAGLAKRPKDSSLCGEKIEIHLGARLPHVTEGLERLKRDLGDDRQ